MLKDQLPPSCLIHPACSEPRQKIESIVKRDGIPDPDCPDDPESTRFWATVGSQYKDTEHTSLSMTSTATVATTGDVVGGLMNTSSNSPQISQLALTNGSSSSGGPSLQELVNVINGAGSAPPAEPKAKAKASAKGKAKAKPKASVALQMAKTPQERRDALRLLVQLSFFLVHSKGLMGICAPKNQSIFPNRKNLLTK